MAVLPSMAYAGTLTGSWTLATQYTDNTPIAPTGPTALASTRVEYGSCNGLLFGTKLGEVIVPVPTVTVAVPNIAAGTYCLQGWSKLVNGDESPTASNVGKTVVPSPLPKPPSSFAASIAYTVIKQVDRFVMLPVGTVAPNTACDMTQSVNGYNVVPRTSVSWSGNVQPDVVVAVCSANSSG